jgi:hypothetical protein
MLHTVILLFLSPQKDLPPHGDQTREYVVVSIDFKLCRSKPRKAKTSAILHHYRFEYHAMVHSSMRLI